MRFCVIELPEATADFVPLFLFPTLVLRGAGGMIIFCPGMKSPAGPHCSVPCKSECSGFSF